MFIHSPDDASEAIVKQTTECGERIIQKNIYLLPLLLMAQINQIIEILPLTTLLYSPGEICKTSETQICNSQILRFGRFALFI